MEMVSTSFFPSQFTNLRWPETKLNKGDKMRELIELLIQN